MADNQIVPTDLNFAGTPPVQKSTGFLQGIKNLVKANDEQKFYQNAVNNGLEGIEGTPDNDQIARAYKAKQGFSSLMNEENRDWESIDAYAAANSEDLLDIKEAPEHGSVRDFQNEQMTSELMDEIDSEGMEDNLPEGLEDGETGYTMEDHPEMFDNEGNELSADYETGEYFDANGDVVYSFNTDMNEYVDRAGNVVNIPDEPAYDDELFTQEEVEQEEIDIEAAKELAVKESLIAVARNREARLSGQEQTTFSAQEGF